MERFAISMALLIVIAHTTTSLTSATICAPCECDKHGNCSNPTTSCPPVHNCSAGVVKDKCGCCDVCVRSIGEACRKEPQEKENEDCAMGLKCMHSEDAWYCEQLEPENVRVSRCEPGDLGNIKYDRDRSTFLRKSITLMLIKWEHRARLLAVPC